MKERVRIIIISLAVGVLFIGGCAGVGPSSVARDRFDYTAAISDSWKSQMLLNMVKNRYGDAPIFLEVASVVNQYSVEQEFGLSVSGEIYNPSSPSFISPNLGGRGRYTDRPTITYSPLTGEKFARSLMTPIPPAAILGLIQTGYPVDLVLRAMVHEMNGVRSRFGGGARAQAADPEFYPLLDMMRRIQLAGNIGMRFKKMDKEKEEAVMVMVLRANRDETTDSLAKDVRKILGLDPNANEFRVVYGSFPKDNKEIAVLTRSILDIITDLASYIEVPETHVAEKRVNPTMKEEPVGEIEVPPLIRICSSPQKPTDAFVSVPYRDHWFWIDDKDLPSKRMFSFLMFVFTLTETGGREGAPILTIPAG